MPGQGTIVAVVVDPKAVPLLDPEVTVGPTKTYLAGAHASFQSQYTALT